MNIQHRELKVSKHFFPWETRPSMRFLRWICKRVGLVAFGSRLLFVEDAHNFFFTHVRSTKIRDKHTAAPSTGLGPWLTGKFSTTKSLNCFLRAWKRKNTLRGHPCHQCGLWAHFHTAALAQAGRRITRCHVSDIIIYPREVELSGLAWEGHFSVQLPADTACHPCHRAREKPG